MKQSFDRTKTLTQFTSIAWNNKNDDESLSHEDINDIAIKMILIKKAKNRIIDKTQMWKKFVNIKDKIVSIVR
jgi:hypothetical protein